MEGHREHHAHRPLRGANMLTVMPSPRLAAGKVVMKNLTALLGALLIWSVPAIAQTKPVVIFIATGGTIAMKIDPIKHAPVPAISGEDLLATVPEVSKYATVEVKNVSNVPSDYMDPVRWTALTREVRSGEHTSELQ